MWHSICGPLTGSSYNKRQQTNKNPFANGLAHRIQPMTTTHNVFILMDLGAYHWNSKDDISSSITISLSVKVALFRFHFAKLYTHSNGWITFWVCECGAIDGCSEHSNADQRNILCYCCHNSSGLLKFSVYIFKEWNNLGPRFLGKRKKPSDI